MLDIATVIGKAREYLERHGWLQEELREGEKVCSYGGLLVGAGWLDLEDEDNNIHVNEGETETDLLPVARFLLIHGIGIEPEKEIGPGPINQIVTWNDSEGRSEQDVLDAFAKAEKIAIAGFDPEKGVE